MFPVSYVHNHRTCEFPGMADSVEEILEERREERVKAERMRHRLREHRLIRAAAVEPVVKSMSREERDTIGRMLEEDMVQQLRTLRLDAETLARFEPEELRRYLGKSMGSANG